MSALSQTQKKALSTVIDGGSLDEYKKVTITSLVKRGLIADYDGTWQITPAGKRVATPKKTRAHQKYTLADGTTVPGVTTVIGSNLGWNKNMLIAWARREALAGNDPNKIRDNAADIGTLAHYLIECHLKGKEPDVSEYSPADLSLAENSFLAYLEWEGQHQVKHVYSELQLVSEQYHYGGTIDLVAEVDGYLSLVDFKTSKGVYPEHRLQLAAYQHLYAERFSDGLLPPHILRIGKDGEFQHYKLQSLNKEWEIFKSLLTIHRLRKEIVK